MSLHAREVAAGARFEFGENWQRFLGSLDESRIQRAERSLQGMLDVDGFRGTSFLDVGCGSGLFSLAARRLGARVHSFDYDPRSVACAEELRRRYFENNAQWTISEGSVLDRAYLVSLGRFDYVYAWGVLHHTGAMWQALDNVLVTVAAKGHIFLAIYNHQPLWTPVHTWLKRSYVTAPRPLRPLIGGPLVAFHAGRGLLKDLLTLRSPLARYRDYDQPRGMSWWHDCQDWIGGYPFETATPQAVLDFFRRRSFESQRVVTCGRKSGCNQFVFRRQGGEVAQQGPARADTIANNPSRGHLPQ